MAPITPRHSSFDPYNQNINLTMPDGVTTQAFNIDQIFYLQHVATVSGIMFGTQVGISGILLTILVVMTKPDKRRSVVFCLNVAALVCIFIRSVLLCLELTGAFYNFFNWITGYYESVSGAMRISIAGEVIATLALLFIELSMMFQVKIVCGTLRNLWRRLIDIASVFIVLAVVSVRFTLCVLNSDWDIAHVATETEEQFQTLDNLASASNITTACSIILFSSIFCIKLGHAILERRKLGLKQFGPMQIIFVMGCQTLIVPAIFGILAYIVLKSTQINSFMPVIVATFLPLSSMWASTNTGKAKAAAAAHPLGRRMIPTGNNGSYGCGSGSTEKRDLTCTANTGDTLVNNDSHTALKNVAPNKLGDATSTGGRDSLEVEMQKLGPNIHVDRTYSVHSGQKSSQPARASHLLTDNASSVDLALI